MTPSGPYKSWLMNAALRQARRVQAEVGLRWRQMAGGLSFAAQAAFYPLYAAVQSLRVVGRRLGTGSVGGDRLLSGGDLTDEAIGDVMSLAQRYAAESVWVSAQAIELDQDLDADLWSDGAGQYAVNLANVDLVNANLANRAAAPLPPIAPIASPTADPATPSPDPGLTRRAPAAIQGIASQLTNRALVLIDDRNQAIVLTNDQQYALQQRITQVNAVLAYRRRQAHLPASPNLVRRWLSWMEQGIVAQGFDLFGESDLVLARSAALAAGSDWRLGLALSPANAPAPLTPFNPSNLSPELAANLETVDRTLAQLEQQTRPGRLGELIQAAIDYFFGPPKSLPGLGLPGQAQTEPAIGSDPWTITPEHLHPSLSQGNSTSSSPSDPLNPPELPPSPPPSRPARNWFGLFHRDPPGALTTPTGDQAYLDWDPTDDPPPQRTPMPLDDDDWIDHQGPTRAGLIGAGAPAPGSKRPRSSSSWINNTIFGSKRRRLMGSQSSGSGLVPANANPLAASRPDARSQDSSDDSHPGPSLTTRRTTAPVTDPTLIDTAAKSLGYDRHPLERLLNGLDRLLLGIERGLLWLWRSLMGVLGLR